MAEKIEANLIHRACENRLKGKKGIIHTSHTIVTDVYLSSSGPPAFLIDEDALQVGRVLYQNALTIHSPICPAGAEAAKSDYYFLEVWVDTETKNKKGGNKRLDYTDQLNDILDKITQS